MTTKTEFEREVRAINARTYRTYILSCVAALVVAGTLTFSFDHWTDKGDVQIFAWGLVTTFSLIGWPTFYALHLANRQTATLTKEYEEDQRAMNWQRLQEHRKAVEARIHGTEKQV